jgi:hypothetical protein
VFKTAQLLYAQHFFMSYPAAYVFNKEEPQRLHIGEVYLGEPQEETKRYSQWPHRSRSGS